jgi:hypothetical protein
MLTSLERTTIWLYTVITDSDDGDETDGGDDDDDTMIVSIQISLS